MTFLLRSIILVVLFGMVAVVSTGFWKVWEVVDFPRYKTVATLKGHSFRVRNRGEAALPSGKRCLVYEYRTDALDKATATKNADELIPLIAAETSAQGLDCIRIDGNWDTAKKGFLAYGATIETEFSKTNAGRWEKVRNDAHAQ